MHAWAASRGCSLPINVESSVLLDECRGHIAYSRPSPCQSIFSWIFLASLSPIHPWTGVPVSDDPFFCTLPKNCNRRCCMRFATSWSRSTLSHTSLFLILSLQITPAILLKQDISNTRSLCLLQGPSFRGCAAY